MHDAPASSAKVIEDMEYVRRGERTLTGDLYLPSDATHVPCLLAVHGGAWQRGTRKNHRRIGRYLAEHGVGLFSISYRFAPEHPFPAAFQDARSGVQFLKAKGAGLGIDPQRIGIIGDSAGGHSATMVALAGDHPDFTGGEQPFPGVSTKVKVCVPVYGVYDLLAHWEFERAFTPSVSGAEVYLGFDPVQDRLAYHHASPINYVSRAANPTTFFLCWGGRDDVVDPTTQSMALLTALKRADIYTRTCAVTEAPHFWLSDPLHEPGSFSGFLAPRLLRFLQDRL